MIWKYNNIQYLKNRQPKLTVLILHMSHWRNRYILFYIMWIYVLKRLLHIINIPILLTEFWGWKLSKTSSDVIHIASVACGNKERVKVLLPMINSAILMSHSKLNFHLIADVEPELEIENIVFFHLFNFL